MKQLLHASEIVFDTLTNEITKIEKAFEPGHPVREALKNARYDVDLARQLNRKDRRQEQTNWVFVAEVSNQEYVL